MIKNGIVGRIQSMPPEMDTRHSKKKREGKGMSRGDTD